MDARVTGLSMTDCQSHTICLEKLVSFSFSPSCLTAWEAPGRVFTGASFFSWGHKRTGIRSTLFPESLLSSAPMIPSVCWWSRCPQKQKEDGIAFILEARFWDEQNSSVGGAFFWTSIFHKVGQKSLFLSGYGAVAQKIKNLPAMWETWVRSLD